MTHAPSSVLESTECLWQSGVVCRGLPKEVLGVSGNLVFQPGGSVGEISGELLKMLGESWLFVGLLAVLGVSWAVWGSLWGWGLLGWAVQCLVAPWQGGGLAG